mmetsp:Transcript_14579/g.18486  ORF Transcript_14579/g.18486 Transcript_14579/m.18486 type:complete len:115 (-) Transcript_14579:53-397(-)
MIAQLEKQKADRMQNEANEAANISIESSGNIDSDYYTSSPHEEPPSKKRRTQDDPSYSFTNSLIEGKERDLMASWRGSNSDAHHSMPMEHLDMTGMANDPNEGSVVCYPPTVFK